METSPFTMQRALQKIRHEVATPEWERAKDQLSRFAKLHREAGVSIRRLENDTVRFENFSDLARELRPILQQSGIALDGEHTSTKPLTAQQYGQLADVLEAAVAKCKQEAEASLDATAEELATSLRLRFTHASSLPVPTRILAFAHFLNRLSHFSTNLQPYQLPEEFTGRWTSRLTALAGEAASLASGQPAPRDGYQTGMDNVAGEFLKAAHPLDLAGRFRLLDAMIDKSTELPASAGAMVRDDIAEFQKEILRAKGEQAGVGVPPR